MRFENPIHYMQKRRSNPVEALQRFAFYVYDANRGQRITIFVIPASDEDSAMREAVLRVGRAGLRVKRAGPAVSTGDSTVRYLFVERGPATVFVDDMPRRPLLGPVPEAEVEAVVSAPPALTPQPPMPPPPPIKIRTASGSRKPPPVTPPKKPATKRKKNSAFF